MKRFKAFDPPEYVDWKLDPAVLREFSARLGGSADRAADVAALSTPLLLRLYDGLVRTRLHDIALKRWVKQGVISKAWLGTGEEAVTVGNVAPLEQGDVVGPMIRNAGAPILRGMPLAECLRGYLATPDSVSRGRDLHIGDYDRGVIAPISMVGSLVPVLAGMALAMKRAAARNAGARSGGTTQSGASGRGGGESSDGSRIALTWVGDGASRTGEFHEGMSLAAALGVPLIVVLQDNGIALGTPASTHLKAPLEAMPAAYGVRWVACDGNNVVDTYLATREMVRACREGRGPAIIVARTFRMGGHATHDEAEGRAIASADDLTHWGLRDPIGVYEEWLVRSGRDLAATVDAGGRIAADDSPASAVRSGDRSSASAEPAPDSAENEASRAALERIEARATADIAAAEREALASRDLAFTPLDATEGVYEIG
jgi:TPP-dependent pyruvate/acetoin dehydrogenase alpha subunit